MNARINAPVTGLPDNSLWSLGRMGRRVLLMAALAILAVMSLVAPGFEEWSFAQTPPQSQEELDKLVREIADGLRCPTCQGISVNDSEAAFSKQIKEKVRKMVMEGQNQEQINAYFVSRYGEWILRAPKKEGFGLVLWGLPIAAILVVGGLLGYRVHRNTREKQLESADENAPAPLTPEQIARVERDLKRFEETE